MQSAQQQLEAVLSGAAPYDSLSDALKSAIRIHIYFKASEILELPTNATMSRALDDLPPTIRELVRVECRRLWNKRGG